MLTSSELKKIRIFACLNDANLAWLSQQAADVHPESGEYLIHEGEPTSSFVVMEGTTEVLKDFMGRQIEVSEQNPGDFFGELAFSWQRRPLPPSAPRHHATWHASTLNTSRN
jgi:thioredoxin reductase (NADPH)